MLKTESDKKSLRDYLILSDEIKRETLSKRNEEMCELEKSRLEMKLATLLEKEKEIFNKTKDLEDMKKNEDQINTKRELKTNESCSHKNDFSKRAQTFTNEEVYFILFEIFITYFLVQRKRKRIA